MSEVIRPKVGLGVFVLKDGQFIMGLRQGAHAAETWGLPGGHLELSESWQECAARETEEEAGLKIKNVRFLTATNDIFTTDKHYVTLFMIADWASGEVVNLEPEKCQKWDWFTLNSLPENCMLPITNLLRDHPDLQLR